MNAMLFNNSFVAELAPVVLTYTLEFNAGNDTVGAVPPCTIVIIVLIELVIKFCIVTFAATWEIAPSSVLR